MKINEQKLQKYITQLKSTECPLCGNNHWSFSDTVYQLMEFDFEGLKLGGTVYPLVLLSCDNCGNTFTISALKAGLIDIPERKETTGENNGND